ncbi:MAG: hypothetical protein OEV40_14475, partial [Acidimicrobiia bacterium]|nr:hypothetical protein [Acidimicrobiia bacterium]
DQMLGAGGQLTAVEIRADSGPGSVRLPDFWLGPVWFEFDGEPEEATIHLHWGDWSRQVQGPLPLRLIYHYTEQGVPLRITTDPEISWRVGIGHRTGGVPINDGWTPVNVDVAHQALSETEVAMLTSLEVSSRDLDDEAEDGSDLER